MLSSLKKHPFAVEAFFESSLVFTFAVPKAEIQYAIPACLTLDTFDDKWAFVAVAMVQTKELRPEGFPKFMGNNFFLIGYRIFVRYTDNVGKRLRGLYILKSETDKKKMELLGNVFTEYNYTTIDIRQEKLPFSLTISSILSDFSVTIGTSEKNDIPLPVGSPFADWKSARRFAGPLPFTFTFDSKTSKVLIVEGARENWEPKPVSVLNYNFSFLDSLHLEGIQLANAFIIKDVPYKWKKGKQEKWIA